MLQALLLVVPCRARLLHSQRLQRVPLPRAVGLLVLRRRQLGLLQVLLMATGLHTHQLRLQQVVPMAKGLLVLYRQQLQGALLPRAAGLLVLDSQQLRLQRALLPRAKGLSVLHSQQLQLLWVLKGLLVLQSQRLRVPLLHRQQLLLVVPRVLGLILQVTCLLHRHQAVGALALLKTLALPLPQVLVEALHFRQPSLRRQQHEEWHQLEEGWLEVEVGVGVVVLCRWV